MPDLEMTGKTVEEAIDKAVLQLGVAREDVEVVVLDRGRGGILGIGAEQARVRVFVKPPRDNGTLAKETVEDLLRAMGVEAAVGEPIKVPAAPDSKEEDGGLVLNIDGEDAGLLIGRRGETLSSLQFVLNFILSRKTQDRVNVTVDVEGYRERRNELLRSMAMRMAERAVATGRSVAMEPLPPRERRIIHMALAEHGKVSTESVGEGDERRVTIIPKRGAMPERRAPMQDRRAPMSERRGPMSDRRGPPQERPGPMPERRGPMPERRGPMAEPPGPPAEPRDPVVEPRDPIADRRAAPMGDRRRTAPRYPPPRRES